MSSKTHYGTVLDKNDVGNYIPIIVEQTFGLIPEYTNTKIHYGPVLEKKNGKYNKIIKQTFKTIPKYTNKKKSNKGGKGKKRRTYKKKRNSNYLKR